MVKDLKVKRRNDRLYYDEIVEMIYRSIPGDVTAEEISEANGVDLEHFVIWKEKFIVGGIERLRGIPSVQEKLLRAENSQLKAYIKAIDKKEVKK